MKRIYLYLVVLLGIFVFNASPALAQEDYVISGTVLDEYEKPLPGATVRAIGLDKAVTTDKDGKYQIVVPKNTKLEVSFVGFVTKTTNGGRVKLKATTTSVGGVEVVSKKKQDLKKVKFVDPKAMISAVDTLLKRMPTMPIVAPYDTAVVHAYIKNEVYERFKKNPEVMTGIANAYFSYKSEWRSMWRFKYPDGSEEVLTDTMLMTDKYCQDSIYAFKYLDYAILADSTYGKSYLLAGDIHRVNGRYLEAMKWYNRGINASPKSPENYLGFAKLVFRNDTTSAVRKMKELAKVDSLYPVNLEIARLYYEIDQLAFAADYYYFAYWDDSLKRNHFTEADYKNYLASNDMVYQVKYGNRIAKMKKNVERDSAQNAFINTANLHTRRYYNVACKGLEKYSDSEGLIRYAFYFTQRLGMNDTAKVYAEKLFTMPNVKLITSDYLNYAKLYAAMGDLSSADKMYNEAFESCLAEIDEIDKEADAGVSKSRKDVLTRKKKNLTNNEDVIVNEHTLLYSEDYEKKITIARHYIEKKKSFGRKDYVAELNQLGAALAVKAQAVDTAKMVNAWKQVDAVYEEMAEISPDDAPNAILTRLEVADYIDDLTGEKTGVDLSQSIIDENKDIALSLTGTQKKCLIKAYEYQLYYHYSLWIKEGGKRNNRRSLHWQKLDQYSGDLMMIDGNNSVAARVSNNIY